MKYAETSKRGYATVSFTPTAVTGEFVFVSSVFANNYSATVGQTMQAGVGVGGRELKKV